MPEHQSGGCLCKAVRYTVSAEPVFAGHCYCRDCQQVTGSPFTTVVAIPLSAFALHQGILGSFAITAQSGRQVTREFCQACGSALFTKAAMVPDLIFVKATSLDDPSWVKPAASCWTSKAQPWAPIPHDTPAFAKNPPME